MTAFSLRPAMLALAPLALALQGCATYSDPVAEPAAPVAQPAAAAEPVGPGLWKVADEDTTIYLFGTIHALPETVEWYRGPIGEALAETQELVTEIPTGAAQDPAMQQMVMASAVLPADQSLRDLLGESDRATYEVALTALGMPPASFDRFKPWFAAMTLSVLPLVQAGYKAESGVEMKLEELAPANAKRGALETLDEQIALFDTLPTDSQTAFLMVSADSIDEIVPMMDRMVDEWLEGDADGLAALLNEGLTDPVLAEALLYARNDRWAEWIDTRMDSPGTVFVAVGAGHLAGAKSVQDYLTARGFTVDRVQ
ncbi:TraB/GumN family protein [Qipengyuania flava]|uniref:TraB/GumN family protein n=1 Tax=Qipengyuania flava TaxID=192812 RepID=UPI001C59D6FA|nr:TraB/GumN family protein [Qipengyuania flava]MBW3168350.1 TraB/GumN family protein [Qipengyuania flava]MBY5965588.1 TraB/GumN family protein [Qipengyuania flava]MBY6011912.1 TraB/GumN family protein [Qipengyuania flava]MBY6026354.1 TraB/GumN family protein [Qipengyuania flava]